MDIKEDGREEESIKAQDIKREGAEGFAAADILGELFKNVAPGESDATALEAISDEIYEGAKDIPCESGGDDNATTCESGGDDNATTCERGDEIADDVSVDSDNVINVENEYDNATLSSDGKVVADTYIEDRQISIDLGDGTSNEKSDNADVADENGDVPSSAAAAEEVSDANVTTESDNTDASEDDLPSPDAKAEGEDAVSVDTESRSEDTDEERERYYHETRDPNRTERLSPTPTLQLTEATPGKEESTEQLSIFDIKAQPGEPKGKKLIESIFDFLELFVFTLAVVVLLLSFFFRHSVVDGDSMLGTLHNGEHLIISDLFYTPERGDIVVFEDHSTGFKKPLIKRVIGVGGDEIRISGKKVYLNGELLEEDYVYVDGYYSDVTITLVVPEGELFVMGDHRNESSDSRIFGTISEDSVIGRVVLRFYPFDKFGAVD